MGWNDHFLNAGEDEDMSHSDMAIPEQQKEEFFKVSSANFLNLTVTHYIELAFEITKGFERKECHGTLNGCRVVVPFKGHLYEILVNPIAPIPEVKND